MYKFKIKLPWNEENVFYTKRKLLNFKITLPLAKLDMVSSRLLSNCLIYSDHIPVNIQLVTFLLLFIIGALSIEAKTINFW